MSLVPTLVFIMGLTIGIFGTAVSYGYRENNRETMKPLVKVNKNMARCPNPRCGMIIRVGQRMNCVKYCTCCGQRVRNDLKGGITYGTEPDKLRCNHVE